MMDVAARPVGRTDSIAAAGSPPPTGNPEAAVLGAAGFGGVTTRALARGGPAFSSGRAASGQPITRQQPSGDALTEAISHEAPPLRSSSGRAKKPRPGEPAGEAPRSLARRRGHAPVSRSVWQESMVAWAEAGVEWRRPADWAPAVLQSHHTEPMPAIRLGQPPRTAAPVPGSAAPAPAARRSDAARRAGGTPAAHRAGGSPGARSAGGSSTAHRAGWSSAAGRAGRSSAARPGSGAAGIARPRTGSRRRALISAGAAAAVLVAAAAVVIEQGAHGPGQPSLLAQPPTGRLADADFPLPPGAGAGAAAPALARVVSAGGTVVAFGPQAGPGARGPLVLVSLDGGWTWRRASMPAAAGSAVGAPVLAAGGQGRWLALGQDGSWTSSNGVSWAPARPIGPLMEGDRVLALARTGGGFLAAGENVGGHGGASRTPVIWTSADGISWQRRSRRQLMLPAPGRRVGALRWVAAEGNVVLVGGDTARSVVKRLSNRQERVVSKATGMWRSADGGARWSAVAAPASHGATAGLAGIAPSGRGFVAVRPGRTAAGRRDAVVFFSASGSSWRFAGLLGARESLQIGQVVGGDDGAVAVGSAAGSRVAFVTTNGRRWRRAASLGRARAVAVTAAAAAPGSLGLFAVAQVASHPQAAAAAPPSLILAGPRRRAVVGQAALAGAARRYTVVREIAIGGGLRVAVGGVNGNPAVWTAMPGRGWSPAGVSGPAGVGGPSPAELSSVAHAGAGWIAVGGGAPGPPEASGTVGAARPARQRPVVLTSPDGRTWSAATGAAALTGPGVALAQVAAGPAGYMVVGARAQGGRTVAASLWSGALASWTSPAWQSGAAGAVSSRMLAVTADGGDFVAAGGIGLHPAIWVSSGGRTWASSALPVPHGAGGAALTAVTASGRLVVAVGDAVLPGPRTAASGFPPFAAGAGPDAADAVPFAAVSRDGGRTWTESVLPAAGGRAAATALAAAPGGFVAAGQTGPAGRQRAVFWWSPDGSRWHAISPAGQGSAGPGSQQITSLLVSGAALTAVGREVSGPDEHTLLWSAPLR